MESIIVFHGHQGLHTKGGECSDVVLDAMSSGVARSEKDQGGDCRIGAPSKTLTSNDSRMPLFSRLG